MFDIRSVQIPFTLPSLAGRKVCSRALQRGLQCFAERHHDRAEALYYKRRRASHTSAKKLAEEVERFALLRRMKTVRAVAMVQEQPRRVRGRPDMPHEVLFTAERER